jgi:pimeloyl-ACP methyl ester carboxylesterase
MPTFTRDGITFNYYDSGAGLPFVFQHGLGGDINQPVGLYAPREGVRLVSLDCRAHGATRPLGAIDKLSISIFTDDLVALLDYLGIGQVVIGGISMGAAVALNCAVRYPSHVSALVLSRPAWFDQPGPSNLAVYDLIAALTREHGPEDGLKEFLQTESYRQVLVASPDAANSLVGQFQHPRAVETVAKLERLPHDSPVHDRSEITAIHMPVLVLASRQDPIHPYEFGVRFANEISGALFSELTPKSVSKVRHAIDVQTSIDAFLYRLLQMDLSKQADYSRPTPAHNRRDKPYPLA